MSKSITENVKQGYGAVAKQGLSSSQEGIAKIAKAFGYSPEDLESIPAEANMGLSCGNPVAMASLKEGETVVDLGSGGGIDVFLAAQKTGPSGLAIGIDMTQEMIDLARKNAEQGGYANTRFYLAEITNMPLEDDSVDCVISNCVLNLVPDKQAAMQEIFRILKPGGRLAISDIALKKELPDFFKNDAAAWNACISGAISIADNEAKLKAAGFADVQVQDTGSDLNAYKEGGVEGCCAPVDPQARMEDGADSACCSPAKPEPAQNTSCCGGSAKEDKKETTNAEETAYHEHMARLAEQADFNEFACSVRIYAIKP